MARLLQTAVMAFGWLFGGLALLACAQSADQPSPSPALAHEPDKRSWGPEQATGQPDTSQAGDQVTAWASRSADDAQEWLVCEYARAVRAKLIAVHETYNPGALCKLTVFNEQGEEVLAWEGEDPTPRNQPQGVSLIPVKLDFPIRRVKLYLDSPAVPGWNEIDAVGLEDEEGNTQWAVAVEASSTYAEPAVAAAAASEKRSWGPEQAEGEPDTSEPGDQVTAWASASADGQQEWLICEYETPQVPAEIVVHETYNPGAVYKITVLDEAGQETLAWEGEDPTPPSEPRGVSVFPVALEAPVGKVKLYLDSPAVPGWNEIDAVGLRGADGQTQWARRVEASSTYAAADSAPATIVVSTAELLQLRQDVQELKQQVSELQQLRDELRALKEMLGKRVEE